MAVAQRDRAAAEPPGIGAITKPSAAPDRAELTRCRDSDGKWKLVKED